MHDLRHLITLVESAQGDIAQHDVAQEVVSRLGRYFHEGSPSDHYGMKWAEINFNDPEVDGTYFILYGATAGLDDLVPDLMFLFGKMQGHHTTGMNARLSKPILGHNRMIIIRCTPSDDNAEAVKNKVVHSYETHHVIRHEVIHYLDYARRTGKPQKALTKGDFRDDPHNDMAGYYNSSEEFNAYFHNIANHLLSLISAMQQHPDAAKDYADLYDFDPDFRTMLKKTMTPGAFVGLRGFLKHLDPRNKQRAIKRIYALHQRAKELLADQPEPVKEEAQEPAWHKVGEPYKMPIADLTLGTDIFNARVKWVNEPSYVHANSEPVMVTTKPNNPKPYVLDGYHRIVQAQRNGEDQIMVQQVERNPRYDPDA